MAKVDQKLQMIGTSIILQAQQQRAAIISQADQLREQEIEAYRDDIMEKMFRQTQQRSRDIRQNTVRTLAKAEQSARQSLLRHRQTLADKVFAGAAQRLAAYTDTDQYRDAVLEQLRQLAGRYDHSKSTLFLREADLALADRIATILPNCQVTAAKDIKIGGFRLRNTGERVLIDETLDQKLAAQREWFYLNCKMTII